MTEAKNREIRTKKIKDLVSIVENMDIQTVDIQIIHAHHTTTIDTTILISDI